MSAWRVLLIVSAIAITLFVASDALLSHSGSFWRFVEQRTDSPEDQPLRVEAQLSVRDRDAPTLLFLGNSLVQTDVSESLLADALELSDHQVEKLWLPAANGLEMAMLTPDIVELRPRAVVFVATVWVLYTHVDLDRVRLYHPGFALQLFDLPEIFHERAAHAAQLVQSQHVVLRHRDRLRRLLFRNALRTPDDLETTEQIGAFRSARDAAERGDFHCQNVQVRALEQMAKQLRAAAIPVLVAAAPVNYPWGRDAELLAALDECLGALADSTGFVYAGGLDPNGYGSELFRDDLHLTPRGRRRYTQELLPDIEALLKPS